MSYKNGIVFKVCVLIFSLCLLFIVSSLAFAQYLPQLYAGFPGYPFENGSLDTMRISYPLINSTNGVYNTNGIYNSLIGTGVMNGQGMNLTTNRLVPSLFSNINSLGNSLGAIGLGIMDPYLLGHPFTTGGLSIFPGSVSGVEVVGGFRALGDIGSLTFSGMPAGFISMDGLGSLAGLFCLGNSAGLIMNGSTGLISSLGF